MTKKSPKKTLPKFETTKLGAAELSQAVGGMRAITGATRSICHIDGVDDND